MSSFSIGNPRRLLQILYLAAGTLLIIALVRSFGPGNAEWVKTVVGDKPANNDAQKQPAQETAKPASPIGQTIPSAWDELNGSGTRLAMKEHMRKAEASWAKTVKQRHAMIKKDWGTADKMPLYAATDDAGYWRSPYTVWDFTPAAYGCPHEMERVGRMGDGGKWVCGMSRYEASSKTQPCIVYSFGVRDESSFENELLSRTNCSVWAYDFSVVDFGKQLEPSNRARAKFLQAGIAGTSQPNQNPPFYSIADLMKQNGHDYIDILKMDIEMYEFESMDGFMRDFPKPSDFPIGQFMVEIHFFGGHVTSASYLEWWERLEDRGMRPTWTEPNLLAVTLNNDHNMFPNMAEYTLLNVNDRKSVIFGAAN